VQKLFERFHGSPDDEKGVLARQLFAELEIHSKLEEELLYPAILAKVERDDETEGNGLDTTDDGEIDQEESSLDDIDGAELDLVEDEEDEAEDEFIASAYDSHGTVKELIQQLQSLDPKSADYRELFTELEDTVTEHVAEEEDEILPLAASQLDVQALGMTMQQRKDDLTSQSSLAA
jgi:hypothetical protein